MTWEVWGRKLPHLFIKANCFDEAIKEARKSHPGYNTGRVVNK